MQANYRKQVKPQTPISFSCNYINILSKQPTNGQHFFKKLKKTHHLIVRKSKFLYEEPVEHCNHNHGLQNDILKVLT